MINKVNLQPTKSREERAESRVNQNYELTPLTSQLYPNSEGVA